MPRGQRLPQALRRRPGEDARAGAPEHARRAAELPGLYMYCTYAITCVYIYIPHTYMCIYVYMYIYTCMYACIRPSATRSERVISRGRGKSAL